jgi:hypothetical protein
VVPATTRSLTALVVTRKRGQSGKQNREVARRGGVDRARDDEQHRDDGRRAGDDGADGVGGGEQFHRRVRGERGQVARQRARRTPVGDRDADGHRRVRDRECRQLGAAPPMREEQAEHDRQPTRDRAKRDQRRGGDDTARRCGRNCGDQADTSCSSLWATRGGGDYNEPA